MIMHPEIGADWELLFDIKFELLTHIVFELTAILLWKSIFYSFTLPKAVNHPFLFGMLSPSSVYCNI
jgi:hypothetical protein